MALPSELCLLSEKALSADFPRVGGGVVNKEGRQTCHLMVTMRWHGVSLCSASLQQHGRHLSLLGVAEEVPEVSGGEAQQ